MVKTQIVLIETDERVLEDIKSLLSLDFNPVYDSHYIVTDLELSFMVEVLHDGRCSVSVDFSRPSYMPKKTAEIITDRFEVVADRDYSIGEPVPLQSMTVYDFLQAKAIKLSKK